MPYPAPFHRLVMIGTLYTDDIFNVTLSFTPSGAGTLPAVTQTLADAVLAEVAEWWAQAVIGSPNTGGIGITQSAKLTSIKLNRIGTDGRYMDPETVEAITAPVAGSQGTFPPPQLTIAATIRGALERSRAGKGRMFFPPSVYTPAVGAVDGKLTTTQATAYGQGVVNLLAALNDVYFAASIPAVAGIASEAGAGAFQTVEKVTVGRVVDTMRSRRNKLDEDPVEVVF